MIAQKPRRYSQGFIETTKGVFTVSVTDDVEMTASGFIKSPASVFEVGSTLVLVEKHGLPPGLITVEQPPWAPGRDEPETILVQRTKFGTYHVDGFLEDGRAVLKGPTPDSLRW